MNLRNLPPSSWLLVVSVLGIAPSLSCSAPDPGAFDIVPRKTISGPPVIPTGPPPVGDGGTPVGDGGTPVGDGGGGNDPTAPVFGTTPFAAGNGGTDRLMTVHNGNGGPTTTALAQTSDCMGCHGPAGSATNKFLAAGIVSETNAEVGVKLANGTLRTTKSGSMDPIFTIDLIAGDNVANARTAVRNATRGKIMNTPITSGGCNQGACHGGGQGVIFKP